VNWGISATAASTSDAEPLNGTSRKRSDPRVRRQVQDVQVKPTPSRTTNQLHFEDLDPHRFEDLVRQLVYGWRNWTVLEPLGRSGADDGIDIRGIETITLPVDLDEPDGDPVGDQRVWYVQCKREKAFGPTKARAVATAAVNGAVEAPFGFILAAPCELSKRTRETLAGQLHDAGVRQVVAWGRADLEDLLFRAENDHLLFAYFGISLQIRRRGITTELRSHLAKKRQVYRAIADLDHRGRSFVFVRDPTRLDYAFPEGREQFEVNNPPWLWTSFTHHSNPGMLPLVFRRHHAWLSADRKTYDFVDTCSHAGPSSEVDKMSPIEQERCRRLHRYFYNAVPKEERAWVNTVGWIPYDNILLVDDLGDAFNEPPHVLVTRDHEHGFFTHIRTYIEVDHSSGGDHIPVDDLRRVVHFPAEIPEVELTDRW
jgi:hypothetical protein